MRHSYGIWVAYLLCVQVVVNAKMDIIECFGRIVDTFSNRDATVNDVFLEVQNAIAIGYDTAILLYPSSGPFEYSNITFPLPHSEVNMSVVLVLFEDDKVIRNNYLYKFSDKNNLILILSKTAWTKYVLYFLYGAISSGLLLTFAILLCKSFNCGYFGNHNREYNENTLNNAPEDEEPPISQQDTRIALSNLRRRFPSVEFSKDDSFDACAICMNDFQSGDKIRVLSCSHAYHADCIDAWLLYKGQKRTCPLCVKKVNLDNSCEQSVAGPSELTPLLTSTHSLHSSLRVSYDSGLSNASGAVDNNPIHSTGELSNLLVEAQGSVNYMQLNESGEEDTQALIV